MDNNNECCPKFNPEPWNEKVVEWKDKKFIKGKVRTFVYIPLNFGGVMTNLMEKVESSNAKTSDNLCLSDHTSKWSMNLYLAVDKAIEGANNITLSGKHISKVYEGDFKDSGKWIHDFIKFAKGKNYKIDNPYMWYTTCPKCAKKYGHNYTVIIAKIID